MIDDFHRTGYHQRKNRKNAQKGRSYRSACEDQSPPFLYPCYFGTDVPTGDQLIAHNNTVEQICEMIGADSLGYLEVERLSDMIGGDKGYCDACFR
jgi:amidophosphoribosyltransferase